MLTNVRLCIGLSLAEESATGHLITAFSVAGTATLTDS
jgi:hypothetical protein